MLNLIKNKLELSRKMKANDKLNSVAEHFDTFTSVIFNCNNQNTARCKANYCYFYNVKLTINYLIYHWLSSFC